MRARLALLLLALPLTTLALACGSGQGGGGAPDSNGPAAPTGGGEGSTDSNGTVPAECSAEALCPMVDLAACCAAECLKAPSGACHSDAELKFTDADVAAAECVFMKLLAHDVGSFSFRTLQVYNIPSGNEAALVSTRVVRFSDGTISSQDQQASGCCGISQFPPVRSQLKPDDFLLDCLTTTDLSKKMRCLLVLQNGPAEGEGCPGSQR